MGARCTTLVVLAVAAAALLTLGGFTTAAALDWSEDIQMTHAGEMYLNASFFGAVVDSHDVIHVSYQVNHANLEGQPPEQAVYQQFDRHGRPITDPLFLGSVFPVEESIERGIKCYDLFLDSRENVHLLWGQDTLLHTMFDREGQHVLSARLQGIFMGALPHAIGIPHGVVDSEGRLVIVALTQSYWDPERQQYDTFVSYGRWTMEGELIDTLHFLAEGVDGELAQDPQICITEGDTLHFRWNQHPFQEAWFYAKVGPDDERIIGPLELFEPTPDEYRLGLWNFLVDDHFRVIHRVYRRFNHRNDLVDQLTQYLPNLEVRYDRTIEGEGYGGVWGHIRFGHNQDIHIATIRVYDPELGYNGCGIAYARFSVDGEYLDSLQIVQRRILTNQMWPLVFSDSSVAVVWSDDRFADGVRNNELFMRYSVRPGRVVDEGDRLLPESTSAITAHPNPFNTEVSIRLLAAHPGQYSLHIQNLIGEEVWSTNVTIPEVGSRTVVWNGTDSRGLPLPSGSYVCVLQGITCRDSIVLRLVK